MTTFKQSPTLADLASDPRWVAWRPEPQRGTGRITKVPKDPHTLRDAASTRPETWGTRPMAEAADQRLPASPHGPGGVGLILGEWPAGYAIGGVDLDSCRHPETGEVEPWAGDVLTLLNTYAEVSPSGTGVKAFFLMAPGAVPTLREARSLERDGFGRSFKRGTGGDHPPAIEVHLGGRYYAVTGGRLPDAPAELRHVPTETIRELLGKVGPAFAKGGGEQAKLDRSARAFRLARQMRAEGEPFADYVAALDADPELAAWKRDKGEAQDGRELRRAWDRAGEAPAPKSFRILTADDLLRAELPPRETILSPWLPSKGLAMIFGPRGIGKTHLTLGCAYAIASGGCFLRWRAPTPRRVLVIDGEMPAATLQERLARIIDAANEAPPDAATIAPLTDEEMGMLIKPLWLATHPGEEAQRIRSEISTTVDDPRLPNWALDYVPDYVWDLVDVAAQRGIEKGRRGEAHDQPLAQSGLIHPGT